MECKFVDQIRKHVDDTPIASGPGAVSLLQLQEGIGPLAAIERLASRDDEALALFEARLRGSGMHDDGGTRELLSRLIESIPVPPAAEPAMLQETEGASEAEAEVARELTDAFGGTHTMGLGGAIGDTAMTFVELILAMINVVLLILIP